MSNFLENLAEPFSETKSYEVGDRLLYNGNIYQVRIAFTGAFDFYNVDILYLTDLISEGGKVVTETSDSGNYFIAEDFILNGSLENDAFTMVTDFGMPDAWGRYAYNATGFRTDGAFATTLPIATGDNCSMQLDFKKRMSIFFISLIVNNGSTSDCPIITLDFYNILNGNSTLIGSFVGSRTDNVKETATVKLNKRIQSDGIKIIFKTGYYPSLKNLYVL